MRYFNYLKYVLLHKYYVYRAWQLYQLEIGFTYVTFWQIFWHDIDKFYPKNFIPYAQTFYAPDGSKQYNETLDFNLAWLRHQKFNKHHYQYWAVIMDRGEVIPLPIPSKHFQEMLIDWIGASWAINGSPEKVLEWWNNTKEVKKNFIHISNHHEADIILKLIFGDEYV